MINGGGQAVAGAHPVEVEEPAVPQCAPLAEGEMTRGADEDAPAGESGGPLLGVPGAAADAVPRVERQGDVRGRRVGETLNDEGSGDHGGAGSLAGTRRPSTNRGNGATPGPEAPVTKPVGPVPTAQVTNRCDGRPGPGALGRAGWRVRGGCADGKCARPPVEFV